MTLRHQIKRLVPEPVKRWRRAIRNRSINKYDAEMAYWKRRFEAEQGRFANAHYERQMLAMANEPDDAFLNGKIVADFGCGPRGSLVWARSARIRIGIDVLVDSYADAFSANLLTHGMMYVKSTERVIPLPADAVDVLYTVNAIDHVDDFPHMCGELLRILKPGGLFLGSFNLNEPVTRCEPQSLNEDLIEEHLLRHLNVLSRRLALKGPKEDVYMHFYRDEPTYDPDKKGLLWVKARLDNPSPGHRETGL